MNIQLKAGTPTALVADALVVGLFEETPLSAELAAIDQAAGGQVSAVLALGDFKPSLNETYTLYGAGKAKRVILVGLGKPSELTLDKIRQAAATGAKAARELKAKRLVLAGFSHPGDRELVQALVEGVELGLYSYDEMRGPLTKEEAPSPVEHLTLVLPKVTKDAEAGLDLGVATSEAVTWVRDLVNRPANFLMASDLVREAREMAGPRDLIVKVLGKKELEAQGFGCLLAVNKGSTEPPAFIIIEYWGGKKKDKPYALVGKGITFDTGGVCIKPASGMEEMKSDMAGAATVLGVMRALADLKAPVNVVGFLSVTDNKPSGSAYKPGDILKSYNGLTVEVLDTDAEGRIVLSDALGYADKNYDPVATIDLATLTGSIIVALGGLVTGLFSNDQELSDRLMESSARTGEKVWPMPTWDVYDEQIESDIADWRNIGRSRGDAIHAAKFLQKFAGKRPWAHLDIAGPSWIDHDRAYEAKGGTGHGVRLLVDLLTR
ncbi:MAG TPA: leucyl aminopeptidase [Stenomitos sp.]